MFVVLVLAAYRITRLITRDTIWEHQRDRLVDALPAKLAELITCPFCAGFWVAVLVTCWATAVADVLEARWPVLVLVAWAVAGAQALCASVDDRLNS